MTAHENPSTPCFSYQMEYPVSQVTSTTVQSTSSHLERRLPRWLRRILSGRGGQGGGRGGRGGRGGGRGRG
ncbi:MAG TPA: hypothetical protein DCG68_00045 [Cryomorphaceae bacterium]|nr:hypothetical protein [Cryomorphaceae bacterium]